MHRYEDVLAGMLPLTFEQVTDFSKYCCSQSLPLSRLFQISQLLFRQSPTLCFAYLSHLQKTELYRSIHNDFTNQSTKIQIFNTLAALTITRAAHAPTHSKEALLTEAIKFLSFSEKVRMMVEKSMTLVRAHQLFYSGEISKAYNFVMKLYDEIKENPHQSHLLVMVTLSLAQFNFIKKNYTKALQLYKKSLEFKRSLPTKARIGMAYSFFYLNKIEMAKAAFTRILHIDPNCVEAIIALATIADREQDHILYFKLIKQAYRLAPKHPLILLHLAQNHLFRNEYVKCIEIGKKGLIQVESMAKFSKCDDSFRNDYEEMKARLHNVVAQSYHAQDMLIEAAQEYTLSNDKCNVGLAQTMCHNQNYTEAAKTIQPLFTTKDRIYNDSLKLIGHIKAKLILKPNDTTPQHYLTQAIKYDRTDFDTRIELSNLLLQSNRIQALRQLQEALAMSKDYKPQLLNNIGVLLIEINETAEAMTMFRRCIEQNNLIQPSDHQTQHALDITVMFNTAICYEVQFLPTKAKQLYLQIIKKNKYYFDAYLTLAYLHFKNNQCSQAIKILESAEKVYDEVKMKFLKIDRVLTLKAYILFVSGSPSQGKDVLRLMGKQKDTYNQLLELAMSYAMIMRKNVQTQVLKKFLRPQREYCVNFCAQDPSNAFGYMMLAIILSTDKKLTKQQGAQFFNSIKQSIQLPTLIYNTGVFFLKYDDYDTSLTTLLLTKGKSKDIEQLVALNHLLKQQYKQSLTSVKKNILLDPSNWRYRLQLTQVNEKKWEKYYECKNKERRDLVLCLYELRKCIAFHMYFSKVNIGEYLKGVEGGQQKERYRMMATKMKLVCEDRRLYVKSYIQSYEKTLREIDIREGEKKRKESDLYEKGENQLEKMLIQSDEEERNMRELEIKRKRALEQAKMKQNQMNQRWIIMNEEEKKESKQKKRRKNNQKNKEIKKKREKRKESSEKQKEISESQSIEEEIPQKPKRLREQEIKEDYKRKRLKKEKSEDEDEDSFIEKEHIPDEKKEEEDQFDMEKYLA